jgi:hypothetical protein
VTLTDPGGGGVFEKDRRRLAALAAGALALAMTVQGCAAPDAAPTSAPAQHPCGAQVDPATARVVDVYLAMLRHLVRQRGHGGPGARVLYLEDHAVPELQEQGIPEWEKRTPAPASDSTAEFAPALRRCLEGVRFDGLPPIRLVDGWGDPAIRTERMAGKGWPADQPRPLRIVDGRLFSLGGVPTEGIRLALSASSLGGFNDATGGLFVLRRDGGSWRVTDHVHDWVT